MEGGRRHEFPHYFSEGKKLFQVVAKIADEPGSLGAILNRLGNRVNLVGITSYQAGDNSAVISAFVEALSEDETAEKLQSLLASSSAVIDSMVKEGKEGILVDTYHTGLETDGEGVMLLRRQSMAQMFHRVFLLFGSGGEALLYEEGTAVGKANGDSMSKLIGADKMRANLDYLRYNLRAQGWGAVTVKEGEGGTNTITIADCFECSDGRGRRSGCHFFRGYIVGNRTAIFGKGFDVEEVKCRLKGDRTCEFSVKLSS